MKRIVVIALALLVTVGSAHAGRKREKTGTVEGGVFTDSKYGFTLTADDNWDFKTMDAEDPFRVSLTQKKFDVPPDYASAPDYTKVPRITLFVENSSFGPFAYVDSLLSRTYKSKMKSVIGREFDILNEPDVTTRTRRPFTLGEDKGVRWDGVAKYKKQVQISATDVGGKLVNGRYMASILAVKHGDLVLVFHVMCEDMAYENVIAQALGIINSLKWPAPGK